MAGASWARTARSCRFTRLRTTARLATCLLTTITNRVGWPGEASAWRTSNRPANALPRRTTAVISRWRRRRWRRASMRFRSAALTASGPSDGAPGGRDDRCSSASVAGIHGPDCGGASWAGTFVLACAIFEKRLEKATPYYQRTGPWSMRSARHPAPPHFLHTLSTFIPFFADSTVV